MIARKRTDGGWVGEYPTGYLCSPSERESYYLSVLLYSILAVMAMVPLLGPIQDRLQGASVSFNEH